MPELDAVIERFVQALATDNEVVYQSAMEILADLGSSAVPRLVEALKAEDRRVRLGAIGALSMMGAEAQSAIRSLRRLTSSEDDEIAEAAAMAVEAITAGCSRKAA